MQVYVCLTMIEFLTVCITHQDVFTLTLCTCMYNTCMHVLPCIVVLEGTFSPSNSDTEPPSIWRVGMLRLICNHVRLCLFKFICTMALILCAHFVLSETKDSMQVKL